MKQFEIRHKLGTIWVGILPETYSYAAADTLAHVFRQTSPSKIKGECCVCLQLTIHGWNHSTGLLGMRFLPQDTTRLDIEVAVCSSAASWDVPIQVGLPKTYARVVLDELTMLLTQQNILGSGTLTVGHGAYDRIYSNDRIFRTLAKSALLLLNPKWDDDITTEEEIVATVLEVIKGSETV